MKTRSVPGGTRIAPGSESLHFHRRFRRGNLDGGYIGEQVGQRVEKSDDERDADDDVFPEGIAIHEPKITKP